MSDVAPARTDRAAERRIATALFCDVVGSTTLAETMDPEDWSEVVNAAVAAMARCVERYDGTMSQFAGDSILALFGAPVAHEDDPYRAVRAALDIVAAVQDLSRRQDLELHVRVGINTGLVVVGDVDAGALAVYSALGDMPNVAARLQSFAEPDTVLISADTYGLVAGDVEVREVGPVELKGREDEVTVYELLDAVRPDQRRRGIPGLNSPMVGRDGELRSLQQLVETAEVGTGRVAAVIGEPGVGKTRLVEELSAAVAARESGIWAVGRCVPFDDELPFHLIASLVRSLAGVSEADTPEVATGAVETLVDTALGPDAAATAHVLALLGLDETGADHDPEQLRAVYTATLRRLIAGLGSVHHPVVLVCEDVHWVDASSAEIVAGLFEIVRTTPTMLLLVMRPERAGLGWGLLTDARREIAEALAEIHLPPLPDADSRMLVANLLEIESLPADLRRLILDKAEGNPFFLEEIVRMLIERELVERRDARWVARPGISDIAVPSTVHGLLASRIDDLPPRAREVGRIAAVIGRTFPVGLLAALDPVPEPADGPAAVLHPGLVELEARGMVRVEATRPELEFSFRHALIHDVMYEGMLKRERRSLHGRVAAAIEQLHADRTDDFAAVLGRHHEEAGNLPDAVGYLLTAGRLAQRRGARMEAYRAFTHALELLDGMDDPDPGLRVRATIGSVAAGMTFVPAARNIEALEAVLPIAEELDDPHELAALYASLLAERGILGENYSHPAYRRQLERAHALAARVVDPAARGSLEATRGQALRASDEHAPAVAPLREAVRLLEEAGQLAKAAYNAAMLADTLATLGDFRAAEEAIARAAELARASGDISAMSDADIIEGRIASERGELREALEHTRRGIERAEVAGNTFCTLAGHFFAADQHLRLGATRDAISHLERSTELAEFCNAGGYEALSHAWLAAARARIGDVEPGSFDGPLDQAVGAGSRSTEALVRLSRAIVRAAEGDVRAATPDFERAITLFDEIGARPGLARARQAYGLALETAGRADDAGAQLRLAAETFEELGIQPDP